MSGRSATCLVASAFRNRCQIACGLLVLPGNTCFQWGGTTARNVNFSALIDVFADPLVPAFEVQQRLAFPNDCIFDFRDKNGVIAGILRSVKTAFQIGESAMQYWCSVGRTIEGGTGLFRMLMKIGRASVELRDRSLSFTKDIH